MRDYFSTALKLVCLVKYYCSVFLTKVRSYPPLALWLTALFLMYEQPPVNMVQGYIPTTMLIFFIMVWFGYLFLSDFDTVTEHLIILQTNSRIVYAVSKILFLLAISLAVSVIGGAFPVVVDLVTRARGAIYFADGIRIADLFGGLILHFIVGTLGVSVAFLFHPNHNKRNDAITIVMLLSFALLAFVKHQIFNFEGALRHLLLVFTPVYEIISRFSDKSVFILRDLAISAMYGGIYFAVIVFVGYWLYGRRVYGPRIAKETTNAG